MWNPPEWKTALCAGVIKTKTNTESTQRVQYKINKKDIMKLKKTYKRNPQYEK